MSNAMKCDRCGGNLETDDAISIIDGICGTCRRGTMRPVGQAALQPASAVEVVFGPEGIGGVATRHSESTLVLDESESVSEPETEEIIVSLTPAEDSPARPFARKSAPAAGIAAQPHRRRRRNLAAGVLVGLAMIAAGVFYAAKNGWTPGDLPRTANQEPQRVPVKLKISPPSASVLLDGEPIGPADADGYIHLKIEPDALRIYTVDASAEGFLPARQAISVLGGKQLFEVALSRKPFEMTVRSEPTGAEVWMGGEMRGLTPLTMTLPATTNGKITLKQMGRKPVVRDIVVPPPGETLVVDAALPRSGPIVHVDTRPQGAQVEVDGIPRGAAPIDVELDDRYLGKDVRITGRLEGHNDATTTVTVPSDVDQISLAQIILPEHGVELRIDSEPSGAEILLEGKSIGIAPLSAKFAPEDAGKAIAVEAVLSGKRMGRRTTTIPPVGPPIDLTVPLNQPVQTVVFAFAARSDRVGEFTALADRAADLIEKLGPTQRMAIVAAAESGVESWPGGSQTLVASSEQKIRAYDRVRTIRAAAAGDIAEVLRAAAASRPDAIYLLVSSDADLTALQSGEIGLPADTDEHLTAVNLIMTQSIGERTWLAEWVTRWHGSISVLEGDTPSRLAGNDPEKAE